MFWNAQLGTVWLWDGGGWTSRSAFGPPLRGFAMASDSARGVVVLFGGWNPSEPVQDTTWEWDGTAWSQRITTIQPSPRSNAAMCYDSERGVVVLFGGATEGGHPGEQVRSDETWEWDGATWTQRIVSICPPGRDDTAMAYDSRRRVSVLFGGRDNALGELGDTWEWDGTTWTQITPSVAPPARHMHAMAYDARRGRTVLYGGEADGITWEYPVQTYPRITQQPAGGVTCLGDPFIFTVSAEGAGELYFEWRKDGEICIDQDGPTFTIEAVNFTHMGSYTVTVWNACGSTASEPAMLSICAGVGGCPSPADVNGDGVLNGLDIQLIVDALLGRF